MTVFVDTPEGMHQLTRKLPDCPKCGLDELWCQQLREGWRLRCYNCTLDSGVKVLPEGMTLDDHIERMVAVYCDFYARMGWALGRDGSA